MSIYVRVCSSCEKAASLSNTLRVFQGVTMEREKGRLNGATKNASYFQVKLTMLTLNAKHVDPSI